MIRPLVLVVIFFLFVSTQSSDGPQAVWQDLTPTEIKQWYTPTDLCMLQSEDRASYPQTVRAEKCASVSGGVRKLQCGVGFSGSSIGNKGAPCFPPFVSRSSFLKGIVGYTDPLQKPLLEVIWNLYRTNMTMVLLGDSLMRQVLATSSSYRHHHYHHLRWSLHIAGLIILNITMYSYTPDTSYATPIYSIETRSDGVRGAARVSPALLFRRRGGTRLTHPWMGQVGTGTRAS